MVWILAGQPWHASLVQMLVRLLALVWQRLTTPLLNGLFFTMRSSFALKVFSGFVLATRFLRPNRAMSSGYQKTPLLSTKVKVLRFFIHSILSIGQRAPIPQSLKLTRIDRLEYSHGSNIFPTPVQVNSNWQKNHQKSHHVDRT